MTEISFQEVSVVFYEFESDSGTIEKYCPRKNRCRKKYFECGTSLDEFDVFGLVRNSQTLEEV
jgi:hypothetical protein